MAGKRDHAGLFKKGNKAAVGSGGPSQRPRVMTQALVSQLNEITKRSRVITEIRLVKGKPKKFFRFDEKTMNNIHHVIERLIENAVEGDMPAIKEIFDRCEGKAVQAIEGTGQDDNAITIRLIKGDDTI